MAVGLALFFLIFEKKILSGNIVCVEAMLVHKPEHEMPPGMFKPVQIP